MGVGSKDDCAKLPQALRAGCEWRFDWLKDASFPRYARQEDAHSKLCMSNTPPQGKVPARRLPQPTHRQDWLRAHRRRRARRKKGHVGRSTIIFSIRRRTRRRRRGGPAVGLALATHVFLPCILHVAYCILRATRSAPCLLTLTLIVVCNSSSQAAPPVESHHNNKKTCLLYCQYLPRPMHHATPHPNQHHSRCAM